jgi:tRNA(Ile)-lysidine synthase
MKNGWQWVLVNNVASLVLDQKWRLRLNQYTHLYIGYSGGLDSSVLVSLIAACPELQIKLTAIHVHHGLSAHADEWLAHCQKNCQTWQIPCHNVQVTVAPGANLEERARIARYQVFEACLGPQDALLLAHHQNDQTETVLLNLFRGAGLDGLAAMPEERLCGQGMLLRPLLHLPRQNLLEYAQQQGLHWIEDEMNVACEWSRSYLRQQIIPLLQNKWPNLNASVARTAQHCQEAKQIVACWIDWEGYDLSSYQLKIHDELRDDLIRCTHILRAWLKLHLGRSPSRACIHELIHTVILANVDAMPKLQIGDWMIRRYQQTLYLTNDSEKSPQNIIWDNFPKPIAWTKNRTITAQLDPQGIPIMPKSRIELKLRQGGEHFHWHGQTQSLKKLLQNWQIPPWERKDYPLVYVNDTLIAIPNYAQSDLILCTGPCERYTISYQK